MEVRKLEVRGVEMPPPFPELFDRLGKVGFYACQEQLIRDREYTSRLDFEQLTESDQGDWSEIARSIYVEILRVAGARAIDQTVLRHKPGRGP